MNYQKHYDQLMETRKDRVLKDGAYYEKHHILPRSMGGTNDPANLVMLTAREHFLAHWLLWRIYRNSKMAYAFRSMCDFKNKTRHVLTGFSSIAYQEAKLAFSLAVKEDNRRRKGVFKKGCVVQVKNKETGETLEFQSTSAVLRHLFENGKA